MLDIVDLSALRICAWNPAKGSYSYRMVCQGAMRPAQALCNMLCFSAVSRVFMGSNCEIAGACVRRIGADLVRATERGSAMGSRQPGTAGGQQVGRRGVCS